ncbi:MAG TPA: hypothetical protein PLD27_04465 [bacterium]|nr:hypothetical protein [bacterium]HOL48220.1 hypothetical protein [bacterium]HPQ18920.1 hypothetical protein [bacterium]
MFESKENEKKVILSTGDIPVKYKIKGIVHAEVRINEENLAKTGGWSNFRVSDAMSKINHGLSEATKNMNGDAVINISYSTLTLPNFEFVIIAYGTVVNFDE